MTQHPITDFCQILSQKLSTDSLEQCKKLEPLVDDVIPPFSERCLPEPIQSDDDLVTAYGWTTIMRSRSTAISEVYFRS